jgi:hypothetical protein
LTEEFIEISPTNGQPYTVQYFERNRFEYHPENAGTDYEVLLGLLGAESLSTQRQVLDRPTAQVPDYPTPLVTAGQPTSLAIPAIGVNAAVEQVGVNAQGNMDVPRNPNNTAWYAPGARPGQQGNAVIAGHVDYAGLGRSSSGGSTPSPRARRSSSPTTRASAVASSSPRSRSILPTTRRCKIFSAAPARPIST